MAQKTIQGSDTLAKQIKRRRNELNLTIAEAALRAGVGTKTWSRYEAGESIRKDKCKGICKALNWCSLPEQDDEKEIVSLQEYRNHEAWSTFLEETYGSGAALTFAIGSDMLGDYIEEDLRELSCMPKGTHLGQLSVSMLCEELPSQFLMNYDYDFLYKMHCELCTMRKRAKYGASMVAHSVLQELILYICCELSSVLRDLSKCEGSENPYNIIDEEWIFDLFDDVDIEMCLFSDNYIDRDHVYHFSHWTKE